MRTLDALRTLEAATVSQRGLITANQAVQLGIDRTTLSRLASAGDLTAVRRGVYALPSASADPFSEARAAWLASAPALFADQRVGSAETPVLSYTSAAEIHGIGNLLPNHHTLTSQTRKQSRQGDIRYRVAPLSSADIAVVDGLNVTSAARTVGDLSSINTDVAHIADLVHDTIGKSLASPKDLAVALQPHSHRFGHPTGQALLSTCLQVAGLPQATRDAIQAIIPFATLEKHQAIAHAHTLAMPAATPPNHLALKIREINRVSETLVNQLQLAGISTAFPGAKQIAMISEALTRCYQPTQAHSAQVQAALQQGPAAKELQETICATTTSKIDHILPSRSLHTENKGYLDGVNKT